MNQHADEVIHLKWDNYGSLHRFNLRRSEWQFSKLIENIRNIQPLFKDTLGYIDEDGDCVMLNSSLEMDEMLELSKVRNEKVIRIKSIGINKEGEQKPIVPQQEKEIHPNILCDLCDKIIAGIRYKCTVCEDYDLCEACEKTGIHPEHGMLRLANPRTPKGPFEMKRRWMRGSRCGRHAPGAPPRGPFTPFAINEAIQSAFHRSGTFPAPNAEAPPRPPKPEQNKQNDPAPDEEPKGAEFLKDVGTMLQQMLANFGIDVDMSIEHNNKREKIPSPTNEAAPLVKTPEMAPTAPIFQAPVPNELKMSGELPPLPPKKDETAQKAAQEVADKTAKEVIEAVTNDVLKKTEEAVGFAVNAVNNIAENPQTKEELEKIMQNAAQTTQFALNHAAEMVKRNSSYIAANAENPQFRSIMTSVSQWADQLAQFYPGINPQDGVKQDKEQQMYVDKPETKSESKKEPTAPESEPKVDAQVDLMTMSTATALEPDEDFVPTINKAMFYQDVKSDDAKDEKKAVDYCSDDSDVEIISSSPSATPPPSNAVSAQPTISPFPAEPVFPHPEFHGFPEDEGWTLMNNANYEAMCKFYEAKRQAEETRRKELEAQLEQRKEQNRLFMEMATLKIEEEANKVNQPIAPPASGTLYPQLQREDECSAGIPYPTMPSTIRPHTKICFFKHPDPNVQAAVDQLEAMGYDNCNGWLTRISEKCQGDISTILDEAVKDPLHLARLD